MIQLPKLSIERDEPAEVRLIENARKWLDSQDEHRPEGIHASDLLDPKLAYWQSLEPQSKTERQVWFFLVGKILHSFILATDGRMDIQASDEGSLEELGIFFSPDKRPEGFPIELKTTRANREPPPSKIQEEFHHYLEQLCIYMVLMNCLRGELWVLFLNMKDEENKTTPSPRCYKVEMTEFQFQLIEPQITRTRDLLIRARETHRPDILPHCRPWKCGKGICSYFDQCRPAGRWGLPRKQWTA